MQSTTSVPSVDVWLQLSDVSRWAVRLFCMFEDQPNFEFIVESNTRLGLILLHGKPAVALNAEELAELRSNEFLIERGGKLEVNAVLTNEWWVILKIDLNLRGELRYG